MTSFIAYLRARLCEHSTWVSIGLAIGGASALPAPWSYAAVAVGAIGALTPTSGDA